MRVLEFRVTDVSLATLKSEVTQNFCPESIQTAYTVARKLRSNARVENLICVWIIHTFFHI